MCVDVLVKRDALFGYVAVMPPLGKILFTRVVDTVVKAIKEGWIVEQEPEIGEAPWCAIRKGAQIPCSRISDVPGGCVLDECYSFSKQPGQRIAHVK